MNKINQNLTYINPYNLLLFNCYNIKIILIFDFSNKYLYDYKFKSRVFSLDNFYKASLKFSAPFSPMLLLRNIIIKMCEYLFFDNDYH